MSSSSVSLAPPLPSRRYRNLDKDQLQKEAEENNRQMVRKMSYDEATERWKCKDCPWGGKFRHKAKAHSRVCGGRQKIRKGGKEKKYVCSRSNCDFVSSSREKLSQHYR